MFGTSRVSIDSDVMFRAPVDLEYLDVSGSIGTDMIGAGVLGCNPDCYRTLSVLPKVTPSIS